jgi:glycosyltransferase involved in cell wall biosynthesis
MMLGKPVVCFLRPEWLESMRKEISEYVDELPIVSATPETVYEMLRDLIEHPQKRREIGLRSRAFALKWHSAEAAAKRFDQIYSGLLSSQGCTSPEFDASKGNATESIFEIVAGAPR